METSGEQQYHPTEPGPPSGDSTQPEELNSGNRLTFASVSAVVLLLICIMLIFYSLNLNRQISRQGETITDLQEQIDRLREELGRDEEIRSLLSSEEIRIIYLEGLQANPDGYGKIMLDPLHQRALFQASKLPVLGADSLYTLWLIRNNDSQRLTTFSITAENSEPLVLIEQLPGISAADELTFSVTAESGQSTPQPRGEIYLIGKSGS
ncbi:MAG: anti-sigma factor [Balneolaceae bacterium]|nr:anti-sigma factor [Balneolaceae bacterium]